MPISALGSAPEFRSARRLSAASSVLLDAALSRRSIWLRMPTQDSTPIQAPMMPIPTTIPRDVHAVSRSWDDAGRTRHNYLRDVETVSSLWDVICVQVKFVRDVSQRLTVVG